jgi:RNA polymerase sigma-70 factor (ECF subfamily)
MDEDYLLAQLKLDNTEAFSTLFEIYYRDLVLLAGGILKERMLCEDIVQTIFLRLWENRATMRITSSLRSYLIQAVKFLCLDEMRHRSVVEEHQSYTADLMQRNDLDFDLDPEHYMLYSELHHRLEGALATLPSSYREVFEMNRFQGMKYHEIAAKLSISERTVQVRIGKAAGLLRDYLKDFLMNILWCL